MALDWRVLLVGLVAVFAVGGLGYFFAAEEQSSQLHQAVPRCQEAAQTR